MLNFIVNPTAGGKHGKRIAKVVKLIKKKLEELQIEYKIYYSRCKGDAKALTELIIKEGADNVVAMGGDGTLHEVINGFSNFENVTLGLIPSGTGNDFASALNIPKSPLKALQKIIDGKVQHVDFMQMPTVRGLNIIGTGIDVDVLKRYESLKRKNKLGYTMCLIKTLFNFQYSDFSARLDDKEPASHTSFIACVANGCAYGGGLRVCPNASPTDNKLDFVTVDKIKKLAIPSAFIKLKAGKVLTLKQSKHQTMEEIKIESDKPLTINVDGELYENIPFEVKIVKNKLKMFL